MKAKRKVGGGASPKRAADCRERVLRLCSGLAGTTIRPAGRHLGFAVRSRRFAWFLDDHHGDGRVSVCLKARPGFKETLLGTDPERYFDPPYLGAQGWLGVYLDRGSVDWREVAGLLTESHRTAAEPRPPTRRGRKVPGSLPPTPPRP